MLTFFFIVFLIDTQRTSDAMMTLTFVGLGVCLLAGGWLYARYAARVREWL